VGKHGSIGKGILMMKKVLVFAAFMATVPLANWLIGNVGAVCIDDGPCLIPVGFGLMAPSGVLMIGLALVLRDWLQELTNWRWSVAAVVAGFVLSFLLANPFIATASAAAFLLSELLDTTVYTWLRDRGRNVAVLLSGIAGAIVDSMLFVYIAFGSLEFSAGNVLGKLYATAVVALYLTWRYRNASLPRNTTNAKK
jgi:uncharacterized PurR-regulated membrane protein YhhQ (DUF165 family)